MNQTLSILIVDDSVVARLGMKKILSEYHFELLEANSGEDALSKLEAGIRPAIIFLDLTMPGMGGIEALRIIKQSYKTIPVVIVTADIQKQTYETIAGIGNYKILRKPAEPESIKTLMSELLGV